MDKPKIKSGEKNKGTKKKEPREEVAVSRLDLHDVRLECSSFDLRVLVWDQLQEKIPAVEWNEAQSILGADLIEQNKALKEENLAILSIWKEYTFTTHSIEDECQNAMYVTKSPLPEPPHVRDLLFKQIKFFIDELSKKNKKDILTSTTPREKVIYDYVTRAASFPSRPLTASGSRDKPTDTRPSSSRSAGSASPPITPNSPHHIITPPDSARQLLSENRNIDLDTLQANVEQLKALLSQEHELLLKDAEFLQFCLEQQADYNAQLQNFTKEKKGSAIPTLQEMKEFNSKLEA